MKVLHVLDHSLPLQSGYVFRSLGILGAQRAMGWETAHLTTPRNNAGEPAQETVDGWTFFRTPKPRGPLAGMPIAREMLEMRAVERRLDAVIAERRPDIVHAHSPVLAGIPAWRSARRAGLPMVYEVRALWEDAAVDLGNTRQGGLRYRATRALETWLMRRAGAVFTLCESMRREIVARGIDPSRIAIIPNAIDVADFPDRPGGDPHLRKALGLEGRTVLGFIGSFYHYEGIDLLLEAFPAIRSAAPDSAVLLVGGGPQADALKRKADALGISDHVRFPGRVPHGEVRRYYDLVDFFVFPRRSLRITELVTPLKPLEAMAERRIVLASDVGGHRELIRPGQTGLLFPPDDPDALARCVIDALGRRAELEQLRENGRRFVESERTWLASAAHYRPLYRRLLEARAAEAGYSGSPASRSPSI